MNERIRTYRQIFRQRVNENDDDLVAIGGSIEPEVLLASYHEGVYPCYSEDEYKLWWCPIDRFLLRPHDVHLSRSLKRVLKKTHFSLTVDQDFTGVIRQCAQAPRPQAGRWLHQELMQSFLVLHRLGYAHSVEVWQEGALIGGLYGLSLGRCFCGESMFHLRSYASRVGFLVLAQYLFREQGFHFVDCQQHSAHMEAMGARFVPRKHFLSLQAETLRHPSMVGNWQQLFPDFPRSSHWLFR